MSDDYLIKTITKDVRDQVYWEIYNFIKKYYDDHSHWFGLLEALKKHIIEQGIKREE